MNNGKIIQWNFPEIQVVGINITKNDDDDVDDDDDDDEVFEENHTKSQCSYNDEKAKDSV